MTDWLPTILSVTGVKISESQLDGYDQWDTLQNGEASLREEILLNIDEKASHNNSALIKNGWKIVSEGDVFLHSDGFLLSVLHARNYL